MRLVGLNTALLAGDDADHGRLRLGTRQLAEGLKDVAPDELVIVLSHHPLRGGWLADEREAEGWVRRLAHVHLCGHVHDADAEERRGGGQTGSFLTITAGAVHGEQGQPPAHGYSLAAVLRAPDGGLRLRIWPRRWTHRARRFDPDAACLPDLSAGQLYAEHALRAG